MNGGDDWRDPPSVEERSREITDRYWSRYEEKVSEKYAGWTDADFDRSWGMTAEMTQEERRALIAAKADQDEFVEDPKRAFEEQLRLRALAEENELLTMLEGESFEKLPAAVRKLYRRMPNNASVRALYDATMRELHERAEDTLRGAMLPAVERIVDLIDCGDEKTELRAATYVFERLAGKTPDVIEHKQDAPFQVVLSRIVAGPRMAAERLDAPQRETDVLEGEIVAQRPSQAPIVFTDTEARDLVRSGDISKRIRALTSGANALDDSWSEERDIMINWKV